MFTDARSIWNTVGAGIHNLNQNISSALESLDQLEERDSEASTSEDIELYKNLLEEAQLQHVELSKQFRLLIAEKDAEIKVLKQKASPDYDKDPNFESMLDMSKLCSENEALRATLQEVESTMRDKARELNDAKAQSTKQVELGVKYKELQEELIKAKNGLLELESQKNETVDNLVAEYSKLAAEFEQKRESDAKRIFQLERLQEMYTTKIDALEHSISEFADRDLSSRESPRSGNSSPVRPQQVQEIKDLRAKVLHLEYDLKEKEAKIRELLEVPAPSLPTPLPLDNTAIEKLQQEVTSLTTALNDAKSDVLRLQVEKQEAELAGKTMHDRIKALQHDLEETQKSLTDATEQSNAKIAEWEAKNGVLSEEIAALKSNAASTTDELLSSLRSDLETAQTQINAMKCDHEKDICEINAAHSSELEKTKKAHDEAMSALRSQLENTSAELKSAQDNIDDLKRSIESITQQLAEKVASADQEKRLLTEQYHAREAELTEKLTSSSRSEIAALEFKLSEEEKRREEALQALRDECTSAKEVAEKEYATRMNEIIEKEKIARDDALKQQAKECEKDKLDALAAQLAELSAKHSSELSAMQEEAATALATALERSNEEHKLQIQQLQEQHTAAMHTLQESMDTVQNEMRLLTAEQDKRIAAAVEEALCKRDEEHAQAMEDLRNEMQGLVDAAQADREKFLALYTKENKARKAIHNKLLEIQGNIRVMCRVRPILDVERRSGQDVDVTNITSTEDIEIAKDPSTKQSFEFDRVFAPAVGQEEVFEAVQPLVVSVLDGYNVCIFAYGQTGSGKTHTMEGYGDQIGVAPRAVHEVFRMIDSMSEDWKYDVTFSILEIYNESIRDLLDSNNNKEKLDVRQGPEGNVVVGLTDVLVTSPEQVLNLMQQAQGNRAVGSHDMNEHSSRSHSILTLVCRGKNLKDTSLTTFGKLHLIDLAGSERISKTDATGDRLKEAQNINRSLSALGDVIQALGKRSAHVPYRNSKLTFLLQDSLGGNSKVMMFVNISPAIYNVGETVCSLNFAHRCRAVELGQAKRNADDNKVRRSGSDVAQSPSPAPRSAGSLGGSASSKKLPMSAPTSRSK